MQLMKVYSIVAVRTLHIWSHSQALPEIAAIDKRWGGGLGMRLFRIA